MILTKAHLGVAGAVVAVLALAFWMWLDGHDSRILAQAQTKQLQAEKDQLQKQVDTLSQSVRDLKDAVDARDRKAQAQVSALAARQEQVKTPDQAIEMLRRVLPEIFKTAQAGAVANPSLGKVDGAAANVPTAPSAVLPAESLVPLSQLVTKCKQNEVQLGACESNLDSVKQQVSLLERQSSLIKQQKQISEKQSDIIGKSKTMGFWSRAKWFVIGGSAGAGVVGGLLATR